jgi:hypothetical protein
MRCAERSSILWCRPITDRTGGRRCRACRRLEDPDRVHRPQRLGPDASHQDRGAVCSGRRRRFPGPGRGGAAACMTTGSKSRRATLADFPSFARVSPDRRTQTRRAAVMFRPRPQGVLSTSPQGRARLRLDHRSDPMTTSRILARSTRVARRLSPAAGRRRRRQRQEWRRPGREQALGEP